ncbi:MAG TPA: recombinase zinc beta ribbon domain-containing protein [Vicinamibacterales bacterium]|nr:recombinase zinc beta ribbon domain-containing protein [Vicinamibacterales bacterium]
MPDADDPGGRWRELARCPACGRPMREEAGTGERLGAYYRCDAHGRFRYAWDDDRLEPVAEHE